MLSSLRTRFGIPGVISVIALVFAMFGGAYAASNNGGGKATASAKAKAGPRGKTGKTGPAGPAGPAGAKGDTGAVGANGKDGANGTNGAPGTSVVSEEFSGEKEGHCGLGNGGSKFTAGTTKTFACNGKNGNNGSIGPQGPTGEINTEGPLPTGKTETGAFSIGGPTITTPGSDAQTVVVPISFPIPLASELTYTAPFGEPATDKALFVKKGASGITHCPGTASEPKADSGYMCVYVAEEPAIGPAPTVLELRVFGNPGSGGPGVGKNGTVLTFLVEKNQINKEIFGTWAVTG